MHLATYLTRFIRLKLGFASPCLPPRFTPPTLTRSTRTGEANSLAFFDFVESGIVRWLCFAAGGVNVAKVEPRPIRQSRKLPSIDEVDHVELPRPSKAQLAGPIDRNQ